MSARKRVIEKYLHIGEDLSEDEDEGDTHKEATKLLEEIPTWYDALNSVHESEVESDAKHTMVNVVGTKMMENLTSATDHLFDGDYDGPTDDALSVEEQYKLKILQKPIKMVMEMGECVLLGATFIHDDSMPQRKLQIALWQYFFFHAGIQYAYEVASKDNNNGMEIDEKFNAKWSELANPKSRTVESRRFWMTHGENGRDEHQCFHYCYGWMLENDYLVVVGAEKDDEGMEEGEESDESN